MKITVDGNTACARIAYAFSDMATIYPITPSSPMAEYCDEAKAKGQKNLFGQVPIITEMQSEAGVAGSVHGSLSSGMLTTTFTSSQGLLLMIPNMCKIAGELLPTVFHVSARALSFHALSIFGDQTDVMATRSTGFAFLCSSSVQEAQDMAVISHIATLKSSVPFMHFFDGFRTSHEIQKIEEVPFETLQKLLPQKEIKDFKNRRLSSTYPHQQGTAQNPDIYFQNREASNPYYNNAILAVKDAMKEFKSLTGRGYAPFDYYGDKNAEEVLVLMGSGAQTAKETTEYLNKNFGTKYGVVSVHLYRPFDAKSFSKVLPISVKRIAVLDRTKESGSGGEPLYKDIVTALFEQDRKDIKVIGGRYGVGGKEFTPAMVKGVFDNLEGSAKNNFTIGINDDITHLSIPFDKTFFINSGNYACKFYGLGSDGTVGANKNSIKIIGENTNYFAQGYFEYDSKKSGSVTISHLRFGKKHTNAPYLITRADFIACHNISFVPKYSMAQDLKENAVFLLNSPFDESELGKILPKDFVDTLRQKKAKLFVVDANKIANECGLGGKINSIMQTCFFYLTNIIPYEKVENLLIESVSKTYARKGEKVVSANINAIKGATKNLKEVDLNSIVSDQIPQGNEDDEHYKNFILPIERKRGDELAVSQFDARGFVKTDTAKFEKRGIATLSPEWIKENCLQCNFCSAVCPHGAIRPVLVDDETLKKAPKSFECLKATGIDGQNFRMQINVKDCTGCENCVNVCPALKKALKMVPSNELYAKEKENYEFSKDIENPKTIFGTQTLKGSQFEKPYFEFSGACSGCGETPYLKLLSQLFGKRLIIANATGCSSIYSGSAPTSPFAQNKDGRGPAWASSLFEDNAEFGLGIAEGVNQNRQILKEEVANYLAKNKKGKISSLLKEWLDNFDDGEKSYKLSKQILPLLKEGEFDTLRQSFTKESVWIVGGDGWAYDIGFGGVDHLLASGKKVNILVLDTEVYSNTGGQMSKSTPLSATAKFSVTGKLTPKKDLGKIAMTYKNVYVAQIGLGANMQQAVTALCEAENFDGPSIVIAYCPCINHGINMTKSQEEIKRAVKSGYWHLYRYNPQSTKRFTLDSPKPDMSYEEFLMGENRYLALSSLSPNLAKTLYAKSREIAEAKYLEYLKMSEE